MDLVTRVSRLMMLIPHQQHTYLQFPPVLLLRPHKTGPTKARRNQAIIASIRSVQPITGMVFLSPFRRPRHPRTPLSTLFHLRPLHVQRSDDKFTRAALLGPHEDGSNQISHTQMTISPFAIPKHARNNTLFLKTLRGTWRMPA